MALTILDTTTITKQTLIILGSSIQTESEAKAVIASLRKIENVHEVCIDLEDRERVVRIECNRPIGAFEIICQIALMGFKCYVLPD